MRIAIRRGTAAQWAAADPVLAQGEPGIETDTGVLKVGDGITTWSSLPTPTGHETANMLATGDESMPREIASSTGQNPASGQFRATFFTARRTETTTQVRIYTGSTAAAATPTLCKVGLYAVTSAGEGVLVAATASDTSLFAASSTGYTVSWTAPVTKHAGTRYAVGPLVISAATMPTFQGSSVQSAEGAAAPRISGALTGLSDLPATFVDGDFASSGLRIYAVVLP